MAKHIPVRATLATTAILGLYAATLAALRPWHTRWGARETEVGGLLPGDERMAYPAATHAITVQAPAAEVWRWLVQIGQDRAGFYSYDWLENLVKADIHNVNRIVPEWQTLKVGDHVRLASKKVYGDVPLLKVVEMETGHYFVLEHWGAFIVEAVDAHSSRLIIRSHGEPKGLGGKLTGFFLLGPAHFIMERKMLLSIKANAERAYRQETSAQTATTG